MAGSIGQGIRSLFTTRLLLRAIFAGMLFPLAVNGRDPVFTSDRHGHYQKKMSGSSRWPERQAEDGNRATGGDAYAADSVSEADSPSIKDASRTATLETSRDTTEEVSDMTALRALWPVAESGGKKSGHSDGTYSSESTPRVLRRSYDIVLAKAGADQLVDGSSIVTLDGSESRGTGSRPVFYEWTQTNGPLVALTSPMDSQTSFIAPASNNHPIYLTFELAVMQGTLLAYDSVHAVVKPASLAEPASEEQTLAWLSALAPLPKVHYSWPMPTVKFGSFNEDILREYARITHSLCVWGEWVNQPVLNRAVSIAGQVNDTGPEIPVTLGLVFRPWMRVFPPDAPPTYVGPEHDGEINLFVSRLATVKDWLEEANQARLGDPIELSAIILECERFFVKQESEPGYEAWNAAIEAKHNAIYLAAKEAFPEARVEWYARGISGLFTLNEYGDSYSAPLYSAPDRAVMRTFFRRTVEAAVAADVEDVTPWVALGSAYIPMPNGSKVWSFDYDYSLIYSWHIGAEINDPWYGDRPTQFAPWHAAKIVIFWPSPWEERIPNWSRHFVSYVRGAHNYTELPR